MPPPIALNVLVGLLMASSLKCPVASIELPPEPAVTPTLQISDTVTTGASPVEEETTDFGALTTMTDFDPVPAAVLTMEMITKLLEDEDPAGLAVEELLKESYGVAGVSK